MSKKVITSKSEVESGGVDHIHIHFLIRYTSRLCVTSLVRKLKQESTVAIWQKHKSPKTYGQRAFGRNILSGQMLTSHLLKIVPCGFYDTLYKDITKNYIVFNQIFNII